MGLSSSALSKSRRSAASEITPGLSHVDNFVEEKSSTAKHSYSTHTHPSYVLWNSFDRALCLRAGPQVHRSVLTGLLARSSRLPKLTIWATSQINCFPIYRFTLTFYLEGSDRKISFLRRQLPDISSHRSDHGA